MKQLAHYPRTDWPFCVKYAASVKEPMKVTAAARPQRATAATLVPDDTPADAVLVKIMSKAS